MQERASGYRSSVASAAAHARESDALSRAQFNSVIISPLVIASLDDKCVKEGARPAGDGFKSPNRSCSVATINEFHSAVSRTIETYHPGAPEDGTNVVKSTDLKPIRDDGATPFFCTQLKSKARKEWNVRANSALTSSVNPIRRITDNLVLDNTNGKHLISLAQGDPALFGSHMKVPEIANSALINVVLDGRNNGYAPSSGLPVCRRAVADYLSKGLPYKLTPQDVTISSGCSQAIQHSIDSLRFHGCNMLLPKPGFPLYETLCKYFGVEVRLYDLLQDRDWEVDLDHVASLADDNTAAIVVCNPGNPSGSVLRSQHLYQIATLAEALKVPIVADEVYSSLAFGKNKFVPMAKFSSTVPVIPVGGVSKNWLAPGWRLGWIAIWDPHGILQRARVVEALSKIMQITLGPCTLIQAAVPKLLESTPHSFFERTLDALRVGGEFCFARVNKIHGLDCPTGPQGSMFMMVRMNPSSFIEIKNDVEFSAALLKEESVLVLPGTGFGLTNWLRIVFALSLSQLGEAWDRIESFCARHALEP